MKSLLILRHAKSSWNKPGLDDHDRPLNKRGKRDAPRMGRLLASRGLIPDVILSSTALRARTTAEEVSRQCGFLGEVQTSTRLYLAGPAEYLAALARLRGNPRTAMVVGHNPGLAELVHLLSGEAQRMPTAALAHVALDVERWSEVRPGLRGTLVDLWMPKELPEGL